MMPQFNRRELDERSRQYGFNRDTFEKVLRLKIILEYFNSQDYFCRYATEQAGKKNREEKEMRTFIPAEPVSSDAEYYS